jgi:uncharacterized protein (DUF58 family)
MTPGRALILFLLVSANFILIDYPGAKIILYGSIILVLLNYLYTLTARANIGVERRSLNPVIFAGINDESLVSVINGSILPYHALLVTDYADLQVSARQSHYFLSSFGGGERKDFDYVLYGRKRGKYKIGPTKLVFGDLIGMFSFSRELDTVREIIVLPRIYKIARLSYKSLQPQGVIRNRVPIFEDPSIITGAREYEHGDDTKKINWKISAKHNKFYINTYQHSISSNSLVLLNLFDQDFDFREKDFYVGQLIEICASLLNEFYRLKQTFAVASNCSKNGSDTVLLTPAGKSENHFVSLLTELAVIDSSRSIPLKSVFDSLKNISWGLSIYLITTRLDRLSLGKLMDLRKRGHQVNIINGGAEIRHELSLWDIGFQSFYAEVLSGLINLYRL